MTDLSDLHIDCHACAAAYASFATPHQEMLIYNRMIVCPSCGNKRCPKANDHTFACTGSNEPGQQGSAY